MRIKRFLPALLLSSSILSIPTIAQEAFLGEIKLVGFNFAPRGYANADGQLLAISSNTALFSLYGTMYGGDGRTSFGLPDLRGRSAIHAGQGPGLTPFTQGSRGGAERVTLSINNMPSHNHTATVHASSAEGDSDVATNNNWAKLDRTDLYSTSAPNVTMSPAAVTLSNTGGGQAFNIRDPYLTLRYVVATQGIFPPRN